MLLWNLDLLTDDPATFFAATALALLALLPMLAFHEVSHGFVANWLGDDTAKRLGRLTLNPLVHLDRAGTILLLIVGFGWAKPVPVNPYRLGMEPRKGMAIVAAAGPASNFAMAILFSLLFRLGLVNLDYSSNAEHILAQFCLLVVQISIILGVLNLIPVPPLDGYRITVGVLPREQAIALASLERYAMPIVMGLLLVILLTGFLGGIVEFLTEGFIGQDIFT